MSAVEKSAHLKEAILIFAKNFFNASDDDRRKLFSELDFTDEDIENAPDEKKEGMQNFRYLRHLFLQEFAKTEFFVANKEFLNEKFINGLLKIEFKETDRIEKLGIDGFINAMVNSFFVKEDKRNLTGNDIIALYNSVLGLVEDKFHKLTATRIASSVYDFFFKTTINYSTEQTILKNPFYTVMLAFFVKNGGFINKDDYSKQSKAVEMRQKFGFKDDDELYLAYQRTPLDTISLSSNGKAFSYVSEYRNRHFYGEQQLPDTLFFNCVLRDTELEQKYNINKQAFLFKLSDYMRTEDSDNLYILEALNVTKLVNTPILPTQQADELKKLRAEMEMMKEEHRRLKGEIGSDNTSSPKAKKDIYDLDMYERLIYTTEHLMAFLLILKTKIINIIKKFKRKQ